MKTEFWIVYVGHQMIAFGDEKTAGTAAAALSRGFHMDGAADPSKPGCKVTMSPVSPRIERVVIDIPRARLREAQPLRCPSLLPFSVDGANPFPSMLRAPAPD